MAGEGADAKVSFPYMTAAQWFGIRAKLRQSVPKAIDVDWVMAALGTSEKGAKNVMPQLRAIGLVDQDGAPSELALDLRDDESYPGAARRVLESLYPQSLRDAYSDPTAEYTKVAPWFMRNAKTGEITANMQAKLYLTLLKAELPSPDQIKAPSARKKVDAASASAPKTRAKAQERAATKGARSEQPNPEDRSANAFVADRRSVPALHLDLQIHIAADASADQIDAVFRSMAKHLYGK